MYERYFNLRESPFNLTPDPRYFFSNHAMQQTFAALCYGVEQRQGMVVITGEAGTGKTTLLKRFIQSAAARVYTVGILDPHLTFAELLRCACGAFGLTPCNADPVSVTEQLERYLVDRLEHDRIVTLLIDEAQDLDDTLLAGLKLFTNLKRLDERLLQLVLLGQPALDTRLATPSNNELRRRIAVRAKLSPLTLDEIRSYIDYRLIAAGYCGEAIFSAPAIERIAAFSRGIPRLINVLCDNALLTACATARRRVGAAIIDEVAGELGLGAPPVSSARWNLQTALLVKPQVATLSIDNDDLANLDETPSDQSENFSADDCANGPAIAAQLARVDESVSREIPWPGLALGFAVLTLVIVAIMVVRPIPDSLEPVSANISSIKQAIAPRLDRFYHALKTHVEDSSAAVVIHSTENVPAAIRTPRPTPDALQAAAVLASQSTAVDDARNRTLNTSLRPQSISPETALPKAQRAGGERSSVSVTPTRPVEFVVVGNSFVRKQPTSDAEILMTLRPGTHVQLVNRRGDYLQVRAPARGLSQGYVHKEDAFFEPLN